ncbi:MAG: Hsp70 family protein, partial [Muribaculaceae bacterium]|nr:Hsp70 family protein [Muribaculaceae bacterium]
MKFGIDLGTTNSAICKMEGGEPVIKKTDTLKDTLPSCISFTRKKVIKAGDSAYNDLRQAKSQATKSWSLGKVNVFIEFKRDMGTDKTSYSSNMDASYSPEQLSAEVLKALKSFIGDETVSAAVITIPAKFKADQIAATKRAALLAGIEHCELLQEPIAASMAYGLSSANKNGQWLVFDFGGGTFDAALIKVEDGIMQVKDTEGDNYLGGKNLDYAVVDDIIIPYLQENFVIDEIMANDANRNILRDAMKFYAEQAKNQLSFKSQADITSQLDEFGEDDEGNEIELDLVVT